MLPYVADNPALGVQTVLDAEILVRAFAHEWAARSTHEFVVQIYEAFGGKGISGRYFCGLLRSEYLYPSEK